MRVKISIASVIHGRPIGLSSFFVNDDNMALVQTAKAGHIPRELTFCGSELGMLSMDDLFKGSGANGKSGAYLPRTTPLEEREPEC